METALTTVFLFTALVGVAAIGVGLFKLMRVVWRSDFQAIKELLRFINRVSLRILPEIRTACVKVFDFFAKIIDFVIENAPTIFASFMVWMLLAITILEFFWVINFDENFISNVYLFHFTLFSFLTCLNLLKIWFGDAPDTKIRRLLILVNSTLAITILASGIVVYVFGDFFAGLIESKSQYIFVFIFAFLPLSIIGMMTIFATIAAIIAIAWFLYIYFTAIPVYIFDEIFDFEHSIMDLRFRKRRAAAASSRALSFIFGLKPQRTPPDDSKGAREATIDEIVKVYAPTDPTAMAFGHRGQPLFLKTEKHVLIMASTRSGKGATLIIPHLLTYRGSAFVLDPKGENARVTGRHRATLNDKVHYLDPFGISGKPKSRFNPMARMTPENMEAESKALAAALFVSSGGQHDYWDMSGQQLVAAIILYVYLSDKFGKEEKDLRRVRQILLSGLDDALEDMQKNTNLAGGLLFDLASSFINTAPREKSSVISTATRQTAVLDNPYIAECVSASGQGEEVNFTDWHKGTMTVYLCLSAPKFPVFNRWLRLVLTSALDEMTDQMTRPPLPVCFMLDELATLGHLESVENAVGLAAGYGIQLVTVFQDVAQMRDLYKGRWPSFISNSGIRAVFNLDDYDTAKYWSDFMGGRLVETTSKNIDLLGYSKGENQSEAMRPLYAPDEIMYKFASGKMLVLMQGQKPIISDRIFYKEDYRLNGLWDEPI